MEEQGFLVKKQHRCCYTGGRAVCSHLKDDWLCCLNNGEISLVSLETGEILFNIGVDGGIGQVGAPLSKIVRNEVSNDEIISFDLSLNDEYIVFSSMKNFVRIVKLQYNDNKKGIPINVVKEGEFKSTINGNISFIIFDNISGLYSSSMIVCGSTKGEILIMNIDSFEITHKYIGGHDKRITMLKMLSVNNKYILYSGDSNGIIRKWNLRFDRLVLLNERLRLQSSLNKCNSMENVSKRESRRKYLENEILKAKAIEKKYFEKLFANEHRSPIINVAFIGKNADIMISLVLEEVCCMCFFLFCISSSLHQK